MTRVLKSIDEVRKVRNSLKGKTISKGFVPTMGALHAAHLELMRRAKFENDLVFVSIFVNPTQFNDPKDLEKYPRTFESDLKLIEGVGVDYLFYPDAESMYPDKYHYKVTEDEFSKVLDGAARPGHFDGVLTVVMKLLQIVAPEHAYFGEKDYQQLKLIEGMVEAFFMDVAIVPCPTFREQDGLAMSSRNMRLSSGQREVAPRFYNILSTSISDQDAAKELAAAGFKVDYVKTQNGRRFGAVFLGDVRLIDNVKI